MYMKVTIRCALSVSLVGVLSLLGCSTSYEDGDQHTEDDLVGRANAKWRNPQSIPVCFTDLSGTGTVERQLRDLATAEFARAGICFTGWNRCSSTTPCPAIRIAVDQEHASDGASGWSYVGPVSWECNPSEPTLWLSPRYAMTSLLHELGHAVGFEHEHEREDHTNDCTWANERSLRQADGSLIFLTEYDENSVMNYCGQDSTLTNLDVQGMRSFYGTTGNECGGGSGGSGGSGGTSGGSGGTGGGSGGSAGTGGSGGSGGGTTTDQSYNYNASNTNNALQNTVNKSISLAAGDTVELGTCGVAGANAGGDTYLRLFKGSTQIAQNDDACGGQGSYMKFVVPASGAGTYDIRGGCYSNSSCNGTVAWKITPSTGTGTGGTSFTFTASNTNSATKNTTNRSVTLAAGQTIDMGTCTVLGSTGQGDTYLRLFNAAGQQVAANDDACDVLSYMRYVVPAGKGGTYQIRSGCYGAESCSGTVAYTVK
jgi:hypothetical protein